MLLPGLGSISLNVGDFVPGSPLNALAVTPSFSEIHLIDLDGGKAEELRRRVGDRKDVFVHEGDSNELLLNKVFPRCRYDHFSRGLCLFDPYALSVNWSVLQTAGRMKSIEVFYNFMIMDANMNVFWKNRDKVAESQIARMDAVWGDPGRKLLNRASSLAVTGRGPFARQPGTPGTISPDVWIKSSEVRSSTYPSAIAEMASEDFFPMRRELQHNRARPAGRAFA